jgi:hypothetical protein
MVNTFTERLGPFVMPRCQAKASSRRRSPYNIYVLLQSLKLNGDILPQIMQRLLHFSTFPMYYFLIILIRYNLICKNVVTRTKCKNFKKIETKWTEQISEIFFSVMQIIAADWQLRMISLCGDSRCCLLTSNCSYEEKR